MPKCPLQSEPRNAMNCDREKCALWSKDKCAFVALADKLETINNSLKNLLKKPM